MAEVKGMPVRVFDRQVLNGLGDIAVDCRGYNAVSVQVLVSGQNPSATISLEGSTDEGGNYLPLPDPNTVKSVTSDLLFDCAVGTPWIKVRIAGISGTFGTGKGFTIVVTPYVSYGQTSISINNTASQNLAEYGGSPVGPSNPVDVQLQGTPTANGNLHLYTGSAWQQARTPGVFKTLAAEAVTTGIPLDAWIPTSGKRFRLMGYALSLSVAGSVILKDSATEMIRTPLMPAGEGQPSPDLGNGILSAAADNALKIDVSASGNVSGFLFGTEE